LNATYPRKIKNRHILIGGFIEITGEWTLFVASAIVEKPEFYEVFIELV